MTAKGVLTEERIREIIARMTPEEKVRLCSGKDFWNTEDYGAHGVPSIMVADGPHGLRKQVVNIDHLGIATSVPATCFPTAATLASSWDRELLTQVGRALAEECRKESVSVVLGPGINIKRHPLCGRNFEYYSEDPFLAGELAAAFIGGVQGEGIGTSLKHYAVNNQEYHRMVTDAVVDERTLREIYLAGFEAAVKQARPWTVMSAYNRVNGEYCSDSRRLLTGILRDEWGFDGVVVSDWGGTNDRVAGLAAGMDLEMPSSGKAFDNEVLAALREGRLAMEDLDASAARILTLVMKSQCPPPRDSACDMEAHHRLARRAAAESTVLLKNQEGILPLQRQGTIAVIGEMAATPRYQGHGSSLINPAHLDCALEEIRAGAGSAAVTYARGYSLDTDKTDRALLAEAVECARGADRVVIFAGLPPIFESEGYDRRDMAMPENHNELIREISLANRNVIVVLSNGSPVAMPWIDGVKGVLESYLGGEASGGGAADVLFGAVNPGGRLAETFPFSEEDTAAHRYFPGVPRQVQYREGLYVGYRYFDTAGKGVRFPFGYGLSYTTFEYSDLGIAKHSEESVTVTLRITNTGGAAGHETVQCYVHDPVTSVHRPEQELKGFRKVFLKPGESAKVSIPLDRRSFAYYDVASGDWRVEPGDFEIRVGASSRDIRLRKTVALSPPFAPAEGDRPSPDEYRYPKSECFEISDGAFAALLGRPVPPAEGDRPYHLNTTMAEARKRLFGRLLYTLVRREAMKLWGGKIDAMTRRIIESGVAEAPLRSMVLMTGGQFRFGFVRGIVDILNGHVFRGIRGMLGGGKKTPQ
ncbi:MAG: glycoside hydrolase family 3 C-terminal domain-containing protein [Spirochaetes bacterium]|nr:glycoside hydrolase family 3 C-terminal domain-containing protein [Spirochaetota bacterium]